MASNDEPPRFAALKAALLEAFFVVLGVVLAYAANEWHESRSEEAQADVALESVRDELAANRAAVADALAYHEGLLSSLRGLASQEGEAAKPEIGIFNRGFIAPATVLSTAWEAARETNALMHMDYTDVLAVSKIYAWQKRYEEQARSVGQVIYGEILRYGTGVFLERAAQLAGIINTFYYREKQLLERYDEALALLASTG